MAAFVDVTKYASSTLNVVKSHVKLIQKYGYDPKTITEDEFKSFVLKLRRNPEKKYTDAYITTILNSIRKINPSFPLTAKMMGLKRRPKGVVKPILDAHVISVISEMIAKSFDVIDNPEFYLNETKSFYDANLAICLVDLTNLRTNEAMQITERNLYEIAAGNPINIKIKKKDSPTTIMTLQTVFSVYFEKMIKCMHYRNEKFNMATDEKFKYKLDRVISCSRSIVNDYIKKFLVAHNCVKKYNYGLRSIRYFNNIKMIEDEKFDLVTKFNRHKETATTINNYNPVQPVEGMNKMMDFLEPVFKTEDIKEEKPKIEIKQEPVY